MNFKEFESLMEKLEVFSLAEIARYLKTTPQAVSNWKSRNQVPHHVVAKINSIISNKNNNDSDNFMRVQNSINGPQPFPNQNDVISLSDLFITLAEQFKVIVLSIFISVFLTFTYVQFVQQPKYVSWASILLPENKTSNFGGLAGIASQFGVDVPTGTRADLSSPTLFPELLRSRTFSLKILEKKFFTNKFNRELTLLSILNDGNDDFSRDREVFIANGLNSLSKILSFEKDNNDKVSIIKVITFEPNLSKELADIVLIELEKLNRFFKSENVTEKISFIEERIKSVKNDLELSENNLKKFNEQNRQVTSPALQLELDRLTSEVEIQKGIFLTLKQQYELAKIEEIQETSIVQVLDRPHVPLNATNKNIISSTVLSLLIGSFIGFIFALLRSYFNNNDIGERKKIRRIKNYVKKKSKDFIFDRKATGTISILMIICLPFYLTYESNNPIFFGRYSLKLLIINIAYIVALIIFFSLFVHKSKKSTY